MDVELGAEIRHRLPALQALTSLRFFAAIYVAVYHLAAGHSLIKWAAAENFLASGDTGVSLFFILSGFILAYNYRRIESLREFWTSRFARIYPVYLVALLLGFAYSFAPAEQMTDHRMLKLFLTVTLLQSWYQPFADSFNGPGWTLSVEAFFYAVFPFVLRSMARIRRRIFGLLCGAYLVCLSVPAVLGMWTPGSHAAATLAAFLVSLRLPVLHLPLFLIGVYLGTGHALNHATRVGPEQGIWSRLPSYLAAVGSFALLCVGPSGVYELVRRGLLALCYAAVIRGLAHVRGGWLTSRWMVLAGEISFSIYILQMPVFRTVLGVTRRLGIGAYASIGAALAALIVTSYFAYRLIELPARISIRRNLAHGLVRAAKI